MECVYSVWAVARIEWRCVRRGEGLLVYLLMLSTE